MAGLAVVDENESSVLVSESSGEGELTVSETETVCGCPAQGLGAMHVMLTEV